MSGRTIEDLPTAKARMGRRWLYILGMQGWDQLHVYVVKCKLLHFSNVINNMRITRFLKCNLLHQLQ